MISDWVKLTRLSNSMVAGLGVWLGQACMPASFSREIFSSGNFFASFFRLNPTSTSSAILESLLGFLIITLLAAAGNIHNDVLDIEADRINRPNRPLPSGRVNVLFASKVAIAIYLFSLLLASFLGREAFTLTLAMAILLIIYNQKLKSLPLWGNGAVALLCALAIYFPEFPNLPKYTGLPMLFAFLTTFARELAKDAEDLEGDAKAGRRTFPLLFGNQASRYLTLALTFTVILLLPLPYFFMEYHVGYLLAIAFGALPLLLLELGSLSKANPAWTQIQKRWKSIMLAGMVAILIGTRF